MTVNPYMGDDAIRPFARPGKLVFSLAKTSNKPRHGLQDAALTRGGTVSDWAARMARLLDEELTESDHRPGGGRHRAGRRGRLRAACPAQWFLVPGIGAQGGDLAATLQSRPAGRRQRRADKRFAQHLAGRRCGRGGAGADGTNQRNSGS